MSIRLDISGISSRLSKVGDIDLSPRLGEICLDFSLELIFSIILGLIGLDNNPFPIKFYLGIMLFPLRYTTFS